MLEWAAAGEGPTLALLVDHDDADREFSYASSAETFAETEPITDVANRLGWTVISMARDWNTIFAAEEIAGLGDYRSGSVSPPCPRIDIRSQPLTALGDTAAGGNRLNHH
jgi:hypothetical protein